MVKKNQSNRRRGDEEVGHLCNRRRRREEKGEGEEETKKSAGEEENGRGSSKLTTDLVMEILSRLSIHSLLQCKAVCVAWPKIILDRDFAQLHLDQAMRKQSQLDDDHLSFVITRTAMSSSSWEDMENNVIYLVEGGMRNKAASTMISFPLNRFWPKELQAVCKHRFKVVGSCNGILCLSMYCRVHHHHPIACICNPITGEYLSLPTKIEPHSSFSYFVTGFGFDARRQDYKVVRIYRRRVPYYEECYPYETEICSVGRDDSWRWVGHFPAKVSSFNPSGELVNGALHWIGRDYSRGTMDWLIIALDMSSEQFYVVPPPPKLSFSNSSPFRLCNIMGNLSLVSFESKNRCVIWEMKEYMVQESWTKGVVHTLDMLFKRPSDRLFIHVASHLGKNIDRYGEFIVPFRFYSTTNHVGSLVSLEDAIERRKKSEPTVTTFFMVQSQTSIF